MTAGRREFGGENRTAAAGEIPGKTAGMTGIYRRKWIPAFAGMTAGRREFVGENRTAAGRNSEKNGVKSGI